MIRVFTTGVLPLMDIIELQGSITLPEEVRTKYSNTNATTTCAGGGDGSSEHNEVNDSANTSASVGGGVADGLTRSIATASVEVLPLGTIHQDQFDPARCTLRMGTLHVNGSRDSFKQPLLVFRRCGAARMAELQRMRAAATVMAVGGGGTLHPHQRRVDDGVSHITSTRAICRGTMRGVSPSRSLPDPSPPPLPPPPPSSSSARKRSRSESNNGSEEEEGDGGEGTVMLSEWLELHPECLCIDTLYFPLPEMERTPGAGEEDVEEREAENESNKRVKTEERETNNDKGGGDEGGSSTATGKEDSSTAIATATATAAGHLAGMDIKDYELVGVIESYVCFNSKPARVFS